MTTIPSDPPRAHLQLSTGPIAYIDEGEGPLVVAVHGLPGSARDFRWLASEAIGRLIRVDLPGFGETPVATGPDASPRGRARVVVELCRALGVTGTLLGHSMGGLVVCEAVEMAPELFPELALVSSVGLRPHKMFRRTPFGFGGWLISNPRRERLGRPLIERLFKAVGFGRYPYSEMRRTVECMTATSIEAHAQNVKRLALPTLVAWCEDDPMIEAEILQELADACPEGPRLCFEEGGHNPQKTHAAALARALWP